MLKYYVSFQVWRTTRTVSKGQSLAEYALILALIAVACIAALTTMGDKINDLFTKLQDAIQGVTDKTPTGT